MTIVTIPKELAQKGDLVLVSRDEYEKFLGWQKRMPAYKEFAPTKAERVAVRRARKNLAEGKYLTLHEFCTQLGLAS